eukprot:8766306-Pyramimonas_sp.AAC.1
MVEAEAQARLRAREGPGDTPAPSLRAERHGGAVADQGAPRRPEPWRRHPEVAPHRQGHAYR